MFKNFRKKITLMIAGFSSILLISMMVVIYFSTFYATVRRDMDMLEIFAEAYSRNGPPANVEGVSEVKESPDFSVTDGLTRSSAVNAVEFTKDGEVKSITNNQFLGFTEEELVDTARKFLANNRSSGVRKDMVYMVDKRDSYDLVMIIKNSPVRDTTLILSVNIVVAGVIFIILGIVLSWVLSGILIKPFEEKDRLQRHFISDASHELKTPVAAIDANLEVLLRNDMYRDNQWLLNVKFENDRITELVKELLDLSRLDSMKYTMTEVDFSTLVERNLLPFESLAFESGRKLEYDIESGIIIDGNICKLEQLVSILIDNSIAHSKGEGTIDVTLRKERSRAVLRVVNPSDEIDDHQLEHIFERFYQLDEARSKTHYGLGLPIAKAIVQIHNGRINVDCREGRITFTVILQESRNKFQ